MKGVRIKANTQGKSVNGEMSGNIAAKVSHALSLGIKALNPFGVQGESEDAGYLAGAHKVRNVLCHYEV